MQWMLQMKQVGGCMGGREGGWMPPPFGRLSEAAGAVQTTKNYDSGQPNNHGFKNSGVIGLNSKTHPPQNKNHANSKLHADTTQPLRGE